MFLNLSVLTVGIVLSFTHNETFVGNGGAGMKALSLGDSFRKTEGTDSNSSSAKEEKSR